VVTLPTRVARRVKSLGRPAGASTASLLSSSSRASRPEGKQRFIELADRLARSRDPKAQARLNEELAVIELVPGSGTTTSVHSKSADGK
jgi:hypothetical protein